MADFQEREAIDDEEKLWKEGKRETFGSKAEREPHMDVVQDRGKSSPTLPSPVRGFTTKGCKDGGLS